MNVSYLRSILIGILVVLNGTRLCLETSKFFLRGETGREVRKGVRMTDGDNVNLCVNLKIL